MIRLSNEFKEERGRRLLEAIMRDVADRTARLQKITMGRSLYFDDRVSKTADEPWPGASNLHLPIILEKIESTVPKLVTAFWGTEPIVHVRRVADEFFPEDTNHAEQYLNWGLESDIPNFYQTIENWFRNTLIDGNSTVKTRWERKWRKALDVISIKRMYDAGEIDAFGDEVEMPRDKVRLEALVEIFGMPDNLSRALTEIEESLDGPLDGWETEVSFIENRRELTAIVRFDASEFVDELDVHIRRRILDRDGPSVDLVEFEDLIVPFRTQCLDTASRVTQQYWLTIGEIEKKVKDGEWKLSKDDLDKLRSRHGEVQPELPENTGPKLQKDALLGESSREQRDTVISAPDNYKVYDPNKLLFFETYCADDVDGDHEEIKVVYHISYDLQKIVHADYLDEVSPSGRVPFTTLRYLPVSDRWYGMGMAEILADINIECNTIINATNNAQELINNPFFFYVPAATVLNPEAIEGLRPGMGIPVQDANGIHFPSFMQQPLANLGAMETLMLFADRVTLSPVNAGNPHVRNSPRTARATLAMMSEGNIKIDVLIERFQHTGWIELCHQIMGLYQRYTPDEKWYYVTGQERPKKVRSEQIRGRMEFSFTGNTINTNREILRTVAQVRYNTIMTHPDMAVDPNARREALRDFLRHWSEGVDIDRLLPAMPGMGGYSHPPMTQQNENQAISIGIAVDVLPTDAHDEHLQVMETFRKSPAFENLPSEAVAVFAMHQRSHMQLLQQAMAAQQQPAGPGQGNNVPLGAGDSDLNALEGGVQ